MWTRFLPHMAELHRVLEDGAIGEPVALSADHGQWFAYDARHRLYAPELAGGALLDLGVYAVSFAHDVLGPPETVQATGVLAETGVDGQVSAVLGYGGRTQALINTTLWAETPTRAAISGTEGRIEVEGRFYSSSPFTVTRRDGETWTFSHPLEKGLQYEAAEVARRVSRGRAGEPADELAGHARGDAHDGRDPRPGGRGLPGRVSGLAPVRHDAHVHAREPAEVPRPATPRIGARRVAGAAGP